jgi:hypothetical protein
MRSTDPGADLAAVIEAAVSEKLERLEARRFATTRHPRQDLADTDTAPASRYVPAPVRRAVFERDGGRCSFVDAQGRRCSERHQLEYHHGLPFGHGGGHGVDNVSLVCHLCRVRHKWHYAESRIMPSPVLGPLSLAVVRAGQSA